MFVLLYIIRPRGNTSTIAIAISPRPVYNVIYEGAKHKIVVQKNMIVSLVFVLKFQLFLNTIFFTKMTSGMNGTKSRRGQRYTALTVHGLLTIHGPNLIYANIAKCKNVLNTGYINHKNSKIKLVHFSWTSIPPNGDCSKQL